MGVSITCPGCGQRLPIPEHSKRRKMQCPECGVYCELPASAPRNVGLPVSPPPAPLAESDVAGSDADDGQPYALIGGKERECPHCRKPLSPEATLCTHCGFNWETGTKAVRVYQPLALHWDAGLPFRRRLAFFVLAEGVALTLTLVGAFLGGHPGESFTSWLTFTALVAFLLGTFDRLDLTRNKRGRVVLTQTWRVCFVARPTTRIPLHEYEGIVVNLSHDAGVLDWLILGVLLLSGIIPGLMWWFLAMQQDTYHVALTRDHGYPERILYRGWNQSRAKEIAKTLHDVSGLPYAG